MSQPASSTLVLSSADENWTHLLVQTHNEAYHLNTVTVEPVAETQLILQVSGATRLELVDGNVQRTYLTRPGHLFFTAAQGSSYQMRWKSLTEDPLRTVHIYLNGDLLARTAAALTGADSARIELIEGSSICDPFLEQVGYQLAKELEGGDAGSQLYAEAAAQLIAVHLLRKHCILKQQIPDYKGGLPPYRLRWVKEYIQAHLDRTISLNDLAVIAQVSAYHFCRTFKQATGKSPNQYVIQQRMEKAQRLLADNKLSITQVALEVGYNSPSHFAQLFQRHTGCTPTEYLLSRLR